MWIGVLWAGLRVAMWITHVGAQISPWPLEKITDFCRVSQTMAALPLLAHQPGPIAAKGEGIAFLWGG